jgi:anthranilate synthase component 2
MKLVIIDNYDSFTHNLAQLFHEFGLTVEVFRHDAIGVAGLQALEPDWVCISPGPKTPAQAGVSAAAVAALAGRVPVLGVCLGMQVINEVFGGRTEPAPTPVHGKRSQVTHLGRGPFAGLPSPLTAARYHSLQCLPGSEELVPLAWAEDGVLMGLMHRALPLWGVQFHPESFLGQYGLEMAENFLRLNPGYPGRELPLPGTPGRFPRLGRAARVEAQREARP